MPGESDWWNVERWLAGICAGTPLVLWAADSMTFRESISAYYSMDQNQWFYVLLTMAAMLFVVNGVIQRRHWYNQVLGAALFGVLIFNQDDVTWLHFLFAGAFFIGNVVVMWWFSDLDENTTRFRWAFVVPIGIVFALWGLVDAVTLFWAEWASLIVIAAHFLLDSIQTTAYRALPPGTNPWDVTDAAKAASTGAHAQSRP